jgi:hypothetical protein
MSRLHLISLPVALPPPAHNRWSNQTAEQSTVPSVSFGVSYTYFGRHVFPRRARVAVTLLQNLPAALCVDEEALSLHVHFELVLQGVGVGLVVTQSVCALWLPGGCPVVALAKFLERPS